MGTSKTDHYLHIFNILEKCSWHKRLSISAFFVFLVGFVLFLIYMYSPIVIETEERVVNTKSLEQRDWEHSQWMKLSKQLRSLFEHWDLQYSENMGEFYGYPDYYGGAYIEEGKLYLMVTCDPEDVREEITDVTGNSEIILRECDYSYSELQELHDRVLMDYKKLRKVYNMDVTILRMIRIDDKTNKVGIWITDNDQDKVKRMASKLEIERDKRIRYIYDPLPDYLKKS